MSGNESGTRSSGNGLGPEAGPQSGPGTRTEAVTEAGTVPGMMEFHISRAAREKYKFEKSLFSSTGNVVFASLSACREFAHRMNLVRESPKHPELAVHAGQLYAMGLIDEAGHVLMARYREEFDPTVMTDALAWFSSIVGPEALDRMLLTFVEQFPGSSVIAGQQTARQWLSGSTNSVPNAEAALEELLLLWTANKNQAFQPFEELFADKPLAEQTVYREVTSQLPGYFALRPLVPVEDAQPMNVLELLLAPVAASPDSLSDQLALIGKLWKPLLRDSLGRFLVVGREILREESLAIWRQFNPPDPVAQAAAEQVARERAAAATRRRREMGLDQWPSEGSAELLVFDDPALAYEKFSPDTAWMPTTVLIAKSTYVWLAQLSREYGRNIHRLDQIPDETLAELARRGMNSLWLIGVWERSRASQTIKQLCGNADAVASAYSLFDYSISADLGGEAAYVHLRDRSYAHGIRLASDMVPNHMGIDSPWVVEHPEWFMSRQDKPYPAYSFEGPDLSNDHRVEIKIEDHYYDQSDAAVVFRRRDRWTGDTRYIYHGNDGTSFPWNDTAQLDYLNPEVREHVIQTILHVARLFPVIRFDAAMTLAKRHIHRLWFPGPGSTGSIPSRAEYGMSEADFNRLMPEEFWREVVDRIATEVPGTLLLAEAFWLMEGYFVRTLGMHRVYNSAFMVMLRDEDNAKYRQVLKNTLEFDPDIMKRYVNFMSNPDERTAIDQFGDGDKCFGVAAMMATLPGLPMFGHGQVEGFTEKYGMEYRRPRFEENSNTWLVDRHQREIAPLLARRSLFAESGNFLLYDFYTADGAVDENVFAYSNRAGDQRAVVVYNNRSGSTHGTIHSSAAYADKGSGQLRQRRLRDGLGLTGFHGAIFAWRDSLTGLEYLRRGGDLSERGLTIELGPYKCHVFLEWRELNPSALEPWDRLCDQLNGRGVPSVQDALAQIELEPVHQAIRAIFDPHTLRLLGEIAQESAATDNRATPSAVPSAISSAKPPSKSIPSNAQFERKRPEQLEQELLDIVAPRVEQLIPIAMKAYMSRLAKETRAVRSQATEPDTDVREESREVAAASLRDALNSAILLPKQLPSSRAAEKVLPGAATGSAGTALWAPLLAWSVLQALAAASLDGKHASSAAPVPSATSPAALAQAALDLFDRLRLRQVLTDCFRAAGLHGEEGARAAARLKVLLLVEAGIGAEKKKPEPAETVAIPRDLWLDPDVRWLTGMHSAENHFYFVQESYEELLWWLALPALLSATAQPVESAQPGQKTKPETKLEMKTALQSEIEAQLAKASEAGYRLDVLLNPTPVAATAKVKEASLPPSPASPSEPPAQPSASTTAQPAIETVSAADATTQATSVEALPEESPAVTGPFVGFPDA